MAIVAQELLVLPILDRSLDDWEATSTERRRRAKEDAERQGLPIAITSAHAENAMLPPWLVNLVGILVLGLDDGPSNPSFCGDVYLKRKLFPKSKAARIISPERRYERGIEREDMIHWAETGRFNNVLDVVEECEESLAQHCLPRGKQKHRPLKTAVVWRSPLLGIVNLPVVLRQIGLEG